MVFWILSLLVQWTGFEHHLLKDIAGFYTVVIFAFLIIVPYLAIFSTFYFEKYGIVPIWKSFLWHSLPFLALALIPNLFSNSLSEDISGFEFKDLQILISPLIYFLLYVNVMKWFVEKKITKKVSI